MMDEAKLTLAADLDNLPTFKSFIEDAARQSGLEQHRLLRLELACDELLVNIMSYAYPGNSGLITVSCQPIESQGISVSIIDSGTAFNPPEAAEPDMTLSETERPSGGIGIFLLKNMVDDIHYERRKACNIITVTMHAAG